MRFCHLIYAGEFFIANPVIHVLTFGILKDASVAVAQLLD
jgi:hypothetical protein